MPGSGVYGRDDKAACQLPARRVQGKAVFTGVPGKVQNGTLNGNRREEPAGERKIPTVH